MKQQKKLNEAVEAARNHGTNHQVDLLVCVVLDGIFENNRWSE